MPAAIVEKLQRRLGMSKKRAEELWEESKEAANESGTKYGFGLVVHILKNKLTPKQLEKLKWKK